MTQWRKGFVEVEFYEDKNHYFFCFADVEKFHFDLDVKQNWIWEINVTEADGYIEAFFDQAGIWVTAGSMTVWTTVD